MNKLKNGDIVELTRNVNAIPAGIYKVEEVAETHFAFTVGKTVYFSISADCEGFLRPVRGSMSKLKITALSTFLERYYVLLFNLAKAPSTSEPPFSACFIAPSVADETIPAHIAHLTQGELT